MTGQGSAPPGPPASAARPAFVEKRISLDEVREGMILARPVISEDRSVLLEAEAVLTGFQIGRLRDWRIRSVAVQSRPGEGAMPPEAIDAFVGRLEASIEKRLSGRTPIEREARSPGASPFRRDEAAAGRRRAVPLRARALRVADDTFRSLRRRDDPDVVPIRGLIESLVDAGLENRHVFTSVVAVQAYDDHLLDHAVKSTVHAILIGYFLGFSTEELYELAECTLLHDVGMTRVPAAIWKKEGAIDQNEFLEIQKHVIYGADLLVDVPGLSRWADVVAYQHHERHDGSGYPKGRAGRLVFEYARIVGLADAYAGMTAPRPHRERMLGYEAMKSILDASDRLFDPKIVRAFLAVMALYPLGSLVALSTGEIAVVVAANPDHPYRPTVKVIRDAAGRRTPEGEEPILDLLGRPDVVIWEALHAPEGLEAVIHIP